LKKEKKNVKKVEKSKEKNGFRDRQFTFGTGGRRPLTHTIDIRATASFFHKVIGSR
jgi:hypothetical protein